ncbi:acyl-CoA reductase [Flagellimonas nanhaiensis]|uniref:Acyl-CoA reductase n=1 Tax=Flagellimonas nanhaiensis TaxID=2292706 RepID=A0A371JV62_9FLAO|nr:acyl-CoA reductase [Allomuricauda nanhaiensis]RDY61660.1 acyl-CoA reductase [Allomuricauda nanhaiensis]
MKVQLPIVKAFVNLGTYLRNYCENDNTQSKAESNIDDAIVNAGQHNGWFTQDNILFALREWAHLLTEENLLQWLNNYDLEKDNDPKTVGIVMAGNIPLVGFHDLLCVLLSGNKVLVKLSSNDKILLPFLAKYLIEQEPSLSEKITFVEGKFEDFDAIIATGSNNTSRYFEYYFSKGPHIIRKNRSSVAILQGTETQEQLKALSADIFQYFGLGCRNVSKLFVPRGYDFEPFFNAVFDSKDIIDHHKYANNYDYNKAVYLMSELKILDNGFLILKEDEGYSSPIAVLFYSYYDSEAELRAQLKEESSMIQCVVSKGNEGEEIPFGNTQKPKLDDYADGVDTMDFLLKL